MFRLIRRHPYLSWTAVCWGVPLVLFNLYPDGADQPHWVAPVAVPAFIIWLITMFLALLFHGDGSGGDSTYVGSGGDSTYYSQAGDRIVRKRDGLRRW